MSNDSLTAEAALQKILDITPLMQEYEDLDLVQAMGRILFEDVKAGMDNPPFRNSAMDGFAFRHRDLSAGHALRLNGKSLAGHPCTGLQQDGDCIRITTGAMVPEWADTVVMQENTHLLGDQLHITQVPAKGDNIRDAGTNMRQGQLLLPAGDRLGAAQMAVLGSAGLRRVRVLRKLRVVIFSTGDELVDPGSSLKAGQIYDSNRLLLTGLLMSPSIEVLDLGICADDKQSLSKVMQAAMDADIAISSGGVSVGDADFVKEVLDQNGKLFMWKILMKPGRPLSAGVLNSGTRFFGLPGNPVSGIVTFKLFVIPAIRKMLGMEQIPLLTMQARCNDALSKDPGRQEYQRGILSQSEEGEWRVSTTGLQDSHVLTSMSEANCFINLPLASAGVAAGETVQVIPFSSFNHQF